MDKSEPALVPQWLKGASGSGSGSTTPHSSSSLQSGRRASHNDYDSSRYFTLTDRTPISSSRRGPSTSGGTSDRSNHDRAYASFSRSSSFRGYDAPERDRDWERDIDLRDREKSFGRDYREKDHDRFDNHQWSSSPLASKYENDAMLKRSQSMTLNRKMENGSKKPGNELGSITSPLVLGNMVNSMQKAAFERNFPSLGSEDRHGGNQSNLTLNPSANSIWHGQGIVGAADVGRASSPGLTVSAGSSQGIVVSGLSVFGADRWSSALADVPILNGGSNGLLTSAQQVSSGTSVSPVSPGPTSASGLNMAEALVQNPPRVRTPPQLFLETQRLEELALKQSRQLIPVTPPMPKTTGLGASEKSKPKSLRGIDSSPSTGGKVGQLIVSSQLNSPLRQTTRPETPKQPQAGKLLVLKPVREKNGVSKSVKYDSSSPTNGGNINNSSIGAPTAGTGAGGNAGLIGTRKVKPLSDWKTVPMPSTSLSTGFDCVTGQRSKDNSLMNEEKKHLSQAQNRSDFFNALRRKASGTVPVTRIQDKSSTSTEDKSLDQKRNGVSDRVGATEANENGSVERVGENSGISLSTVEIACSWNNNATAVNGVDHGEIHTTVDSSETGSPTSVNRSSVIGGSEEEEAAFLRSLGWDENAGGEEALTEEEINAFHQQMKSRGVDATFCRGNHTLRNVAVQMRDQSLENVSSGMSSSDSEPDCDS